MKKLIAYDTPIALIERIEQADIVTLSCVDNENGTQPTPTIKASTWKTGVTASE